MTVEQIPLLTVPRPESDWRPPEILPDLRRYDTLILDTETTGLDILRDRPVGIAVCTPDLKAWYLPWAHEGGGNLDEAKVKSWLVEQIRGKDLVFLNAKYDLHMMLNWDVDPEVLGCRLHDVAYKAALLDDLRRKFSLDDLSTDLLGDRKLKLKTDNAPIHKRAAGEVAGYAIQDARLTARLERLLAPRIVKDELTEVLELEDALIYAVTHMERNGARIDTDKLRRWVRATQEEYQGIILDLHRQTQLRVNPDAPRDLARLFRHLKEPYDQTVKGNPSFTAAFLNRAAVNQPLIGQALRARRVGSLRSKYLVKYQRALVGDRLPFNLHQLKTNNYGTVTGRFSSSRVNIQQVMSVELNNDYLPEYVIRELFIPQPGTRWVRADASQIEFRLFAHFSRSPRLIREYNENPDVDFHVLVAKMVRMIRKYAKNVNFAKLFGAGLDKFCEMVSVDENEGQRMMDQYDREFPEARQLMNQAMNVARRRGYVKTLLNRRRRYPDGDRLHSALNAAIQGSAADIMKRKILELYRERKTIDLFMRFPVHDEQNGDVNSEAAANRMRECLNQQSFDLRVPITWKVTTGANWKEAS